MIFGLTQEQSDLRSLVQRFLAGRAPSAATRQWMDSDEGYDPEVWQEMAQGLGLHGLAIPAKFGGLDCGVTELAIVFEELGRALVPSPFFATVGLAAQTLTASGDDAACHRYLPRIAEGGLTATLAVCAQGSWDLGDVTAVAVPGEDGSWLVTGTYMFVVDGASARLLLAVARDGDRLGLFAVNTHGDGVARSQLEVIDPTRRLARVELNSAKARRIGGDASAEPFLSRALDLATVVLAAEQVGGAQACLDSAVQYARVRVQFERPIGSFQAIKHKLADVFVDLEAARAAVLYAASTAAGADGGDLEMASAVAGAYCGPTYTRAAKENIQVHGGIGFTWEHDAHLHLKRAKTSELLFGTPRVHRDRVADLAWI